MQATQEEVHAEVSEEDGDEGEKEVDVIGRRPAQELENASVGGYGVDQQGNQRPGLLRIPIPVAAPGYVRPNGACYNACREEKEAEIEHQT